MKRFVLLTMALISTGLLLTCGSAPLTGRTQLLLVSEAEMNQMGDEAYTEILSGAQLSRNRTYTEMIKRVGPRIAGSAQAYSDGFAWDYNVIADSQLNAFCLPGGKIAFYEGIFEVMTCEADVAVVMGHEVAHATNQHGNERMSTGMASQAGFNVIEAFLGGGESKSAAAPWIMAGLGLGTQVGISLPFNRKHESEADEVGLMFMAEAGYDPRVAIAFWERFGKVTSGGDRPPAFLSTHPQPEDRARALAELMPRAMKLYEKSPKYGRGQEL